MKTYKDVYKLPLKQWKDFSHVSDAMGNFVFQFEPRFDSDGNFKTGWQNLECAIIDCINGDNVVFKRKFTSEGGRIFMDDDKRPIITIRGWGNLTGIGGHNLNENDAANVQDTFEKFIVDRLNSSNQTI